MTKSLDAYDSNTVFIANRASTRSKPADHRFKLIKQIF